MEYTKNIQIQRKRFIGIVLNVLIIGITLNYIAAYIFETYIKNRLSILLFSLLLLVIFIFILFLELFAIKGYSTKFEATIAFDVNDDIVLIPEYVFSEELCLYLNALRVSVRTSYTKKP